MTCVDSTRTSTSTSYSACLRRTFRTSPRASAYSTSGTTGESRLSVHLYQASALRQLCDNPSNSLLIENNGVTPDWGCNPFSSDTVVFNEKRIAWCKWVLTFQAASGLGFRLQTQWLHYTMQKVLHCTESDLDSNSNGYLQE